MSSTVSSIRTVEHKGTTFVLVRDIDGLWTVSRGNDGPVLDRDRYQNDIIARIRLGKYDIGEASE